MSDVICFIGTNGEMYSDQDKSPTIGTSSTSITVFRCILWGKITGPVNDMVPLCPNCHAMVHHKTPPMETDDLK